VISGQTHDELQQMPLSNARTTLRACCVEPFSGRTAHARHPPRRIKYENYLTRRNKSEILSWYRGGLCLQFFPHLNRRAFLSAAALHSPRLLSFLFALIIARTHGPASVPRSTVRAASFRIVFQTVAARIALRPPFLPLAAVHFAMRKISGRILLL